jgi:hypothetical protein
VSDTIEVKTAVKFRAWDVPASAMLDVGDEGAFPVPLVELDDDVVDALVRRWLDNLYANRAMAAPFTYHGRVRAA